MMGRRTAKIGVMALLFSKARILWVSRHPPLIAQIEWLRKKCGNVDIIRYDKRVGTAEEVINYAEKIDADIIIPVLPLTIVARLVELAKGKMEVWWANMVLLHNDESEECPMLDRRTDTMIYTREEKNGFYKKMS